MQVCDESEAKSWVEKWRPHDLEQVVVRDWVRRSLLQMIETCSFPHMVFFGPPGIGKTTIVMAFLRKIYGESMPMGNVLMINAAYDRNLDFVRSTVQQFVRSSSLTGAKTQMAKRFSLENDKKTRHIKFIVFDEADSLTHESQLALRAEIEQVDRAQNARFVFICNQISGILDPIRSRCAEFRLEPLLADIASSRLESIAAKENIRFENADAVEALLKVNAGDMRRAINSMQSIYLQKKTRKDQIVVIQAEDVYRNACIPSVQDCARVVKRLQQSPSLLDSVEYMEQIVLSSQWTAVGLVESFHQWVEDRPECPWGDVCLAEFTLDLARLQHRMSCSHNPNDIHLKAFTAILRQFCMRTV